MNRPVRESADKLNYKCMGIDECAENEINRYVAPQIEIVLVEVEKGFAGSSTENLEWGDGVRV